MFRFPFAAFLLIHGLLHLLGLLEAFVPGSLPRLSVRISKSVGLVWLLAGGLFMGAAYLYWQKNDNWPLIVFLGIIASQMSILLAWKDAMYGTLANVLVLAIALITFLAQSFDRMITTESNAMESIASIDHPVVTEQQLDSLPQPVKKWLAAAGCVGKPRIQALRLKQVGRIRPTPESRWLPFETQQYLRADEPAFVYRVRISMMPFLNVVGREKLVDGEGQRYFKLLSLVNVTDEGPSQEADSTAMFHFLGGLCWFPDAALSNSISWQAVDSLSARATLHSGGKKVSGVFTFNRRYDLVRFEAERYYSKDKFPVLRRWVIKNTEFNKFGEYRIPTKSSVTWGLAAGDFERLKLEVKEWEPDNPQASGW